MTAPIPFRWSGEAMVPAARFAKQCEKEFVIGEIYPMAVQEERSGVSHRHLFASIREAWLNLPDDLAEQFKTPEHLRKWALIEAGYADERTVVCSSKLEARKIAAFMRPMDEFAIVVARDSVIKVYTAKSQSTRAMNKRDFQESKTKVLDIISGLIGVTPEALSAQASPSIAPGQGQRQPQRSEVA